MSPKDSPTTCFGTVSEVEDFLRARHKRRFAGFVENIGPGKPGAKEAEILTVRERCQNADDANRSLSCAFYVAAGETLCRACRSEAADKLLADATNRLTANIHAKPRVRTITSSRRPCYLTPGCHGTMEATLNEYNGGTQLELMWNCTACKKRAMFSPGKAIRDHRVLNSEPVDVKATPANNVTLTAEELVARDEEYNRRIAEVLNGSLTGADYCG
jgi:hypothetical protein